MSHDQSQRIRGYLELELKDKKWMIISETPDHKSDMIVSHDIPASVLIEVLENIIVELKHGKKV